MRIWDNFKITLLVLVGLWVVLAADLLLPADLRAWGIRPRSLQGLRGILFAPLLHAGARHLAANTGALLVLLTMSLSVGRSLTVRAVALIAGVGGLGVWLLGAPGTVHIGASGIIFGLIGFLLFLGLFRRDWKTLGVSLAVLVLYGGGLFSLLIVIPGVSWTGHIFGFGAGVLAAWLMGGKGR